MKPWISKSSITNLSNYRFKISNMNTENDYDDIDKNRTDKDDLMNVITE